MKQINSCLLFVLFSFFSLLAKAQFDVEKYDKECFLVGTLDEYMGYDRTFEVKGEDAFYQRVEKYRLNELSTVLFLSSLFDSDYQDISIVKTENIVPEIAIYSPGLSAEVDKYYNYEPKVACTAQGNRVYSGKVSGEKIETEKLKLSFLLGAYLCYGKACDNEIGKYRFFMTNAQNKSKLIADLLLKLGCRHIEYLVRSDYIPNGYYVTFTPSAKMQTVINEAERLREYISKIDTRDVEFTADGKKFILKEFPKLDDEELNKRMWKMLGK